MDRQEIAHLLMEWQEQDKENRAILLIAVENNDKEKEYTSTQALAGKGEHIISMLKNAFRKDINQPKLIHRAVQELSAEKIIESILNTQKEEEQK